MRNLHPFSCCVIPPHILRNIARHGTPGDPQRTVNEEVRSGAEGTLQEMDELCRERDGHLSHDITTAVVPRLTVRASRRNVYDARQGRTLPGKLVMSDGAHRSTDVEVNEAFDGSGATYDFFAAVFGRDSIDGRGLRIDSTVHYGRRFDNAFWNGSQMIYGDGDGRIFNRFTGALDVIGHELTHGVTQFTAGLGYHGENGALNEHVSDAFGIMVKQYVHGQTAAESDWLIGAGLFTKAVRGKAIRSMAAPGTAYDDPLLGRDPQPSHMRGYVSTRGDNGGVHINSGIPNHAFYLAALAIGGRTWELLGHVWYQTLTSVLQPADDFQAFADATTDTAGSLYGLNGPVQRAVRDAWSGVGLPPTHTASRVAVRGRRRAAFRAATGNATSATDETHPDH